MEDRTDQTSDRQITTAPGGHILTNAGVWSPDGQSIVYDTRSDPAGAVFDSQSIQIVEVGTGKVRPIFSAGPCGVATFDPTSGRVVFIRGPVEPSPDWSYSATHRQGVLVDPDKPGAAENLDARDLIPPFTPGALRGGTHLHVFSPDGKLVCFTYEDAVLERLEQVASVAPGIETARVSRTVRESAAVFGDANAGWKSVPPTHLPGKPQPAPDAGTDRNARAVGVTLLGRPVAVPPGPHQLHGTGFSVLVTTLTDRPGPGTDQISRAFEEAWVGDAGYLRGDGSRQRYALAFQGRVSSPAGTDVDEVFIVDLPDDLTGPGDGPLQGTETRRPVPPAGTRQRRLTFTTGRKHPGLQGPRHWMRSAPDGSAIGFLMRDDSGVAQFHTVSPSGGPVRQVTAGPHGVDSAFTWSPDGRRVAAVMDSSVVTIDIATGNVDRLTRRSPGENAPRPEACVFSPDGSGIAYVRPVTTGDKRYNQIFVVTVPVDRETR